MLGREMADVGAVLDDDAEDDLSLVIFSALAAMGFLVEDSDDGERLTVLVPV